MAYAVRPATLADVPLLAAQRAAMFRESSGLTSTDEPELVLATTEYLRFAIPEGEYLGWVAESTSSPAHVVGGAGVQLRPILPRPKPGGAGVELGPEAIVLSVFVEPAWR